MRTRWPSGTVPDFAIKKSRVRLPPMAAVYQLQLSVPSLWGQLMSTSESWGVNGHTTRCTSPISVVLQLRLVSGWGLQEMEISAALWALEAWERTLLFTLLYWECSNPVQCSHVDRVSSQIRKIFSVWRYGSLMLTSEDWYPLRTWNNWVILTLTLTWDMHRAHWGRQYETAVMCLWRLVR